MGNIRDISDLISKSTSGSSGDPELIFFNKIPRIGTATVGQTFTIFNYKITKTKTL